MIDGYWFRVTLPLEVLSLIHVEHVYSQSKTGKGLDLPETDPEPRALAQDLIRSQLVCHLSLRHGPGPALSTPEAPGQGKLGRL